MSDKTTPKIGTILDGSEPRDAIHIAVCPLEAGQNLVPGDPVWMKDGKAYKFMASTGELVGLVDPYLRGAVKKGQFFYVFLLPGTITSLAHHWTHPAFEPTAEDRAMARIAEFAAKMGMSAKFLLRSAETWVEYEDYTHMGTNEEYKNATEAEWHQFWNDYEMLKHQPVPRDRREGGVFSCSC